MKKEQSISKKHAGGRKPKFDYTNEKFLATLADYAKKGYTDKEIALALGIAESTYYEKKAELTEFSEVLSRARAQTNIIVRAAFLKTAFGGRIVRTTQYVQKRCECKGKDPDCEICDGTGWITPKQHRTVTETELAPNLMAQQRWLMNYDEDWRKKVMGESEEEDNTVDGFDIEVTFNKKRGLGVTGEDKEGG